jgi:orotidine-5'-phosphate decarboxylase|tara:strand:+ start:1882 stop:2571 length:690 start_codon:yes stop_codon:yes gene_type:complete
MNKKVFIACDSNNVNFVKKIIKDSQNKYLDIGYKFGLEFFYSKKGRAFISKIKSKNIFLDLKLNDIPNTCMAAINSLKDLKNIRYLTVHVNGGLDMMRKIKINAKKINKKIKVIGVTVLTSFSNKSIREIGFNKSIINLVSDQAKLAKAAGLDGIVCSGHEAKYIRDICKKMEIIIPGIRLVGDNIQDQKRVMTPKKAFENGATALVIGRSITKGNIKKNIQKLIKSLK